MKIGNVLSTQVISFEKRFNTRPTGVVSNVSIGQRSTFLNKLSCITFAEMISPCAATSDCKKLNNADGGKLIVIREKI